MYAKEALNDPNQLETIIVRFFGIFFMLFQTSLIWGSLIGSFGMYAFIINVV